MKSTARTAPTYLVRTPYSYCFRYRIPIDLQDVVGRKEIRYSLKTGYIGKAKAMAFRLAGLIQRLCADLRDIIGNEEGCIKINMPDELTPDKIQELIAGWVRQTLKDDEQERTRPAKRQTEDSVDQKYMGYDWVQTSHREALGLSRHIEAMGHRVDTILDEQGIDIDKDSDSYHQLCRDMLKASIKVLEVEKERTYGDYATSGTDEQVVESIAGRKPQGQPVVSTQPSISLQDLIKDYQDERIKAGRWTEITIRNYRPRFNTMVQFIGEDTQVSTITRQQMLDYKKLLSSLPKGFARLKQFKNISGLKPEDIKTDKALLDTTTLRNYIQTAESVLSHGVRNGYLDRNHAEGLKPPKKKHARDQRQIFDDSDLQRLFDADQYSKHSQPYQYWLPILGLYTGCRLEELCQLYVEDLKQTEKGIWYLDINSGKDKKLKNEASDRAVPLHPVVVSLGFPEFAQKANEQGNERVFQELKKQSGSYGHYASRWFNRFKEKAGIDMTPNKKVFHSFRHSFTDMLYKEQVMETIIEELTGRAGKTETSGRYAKGYRVNDLYDILAERLNYNIDLSHFRESNL